VAPDEVPPVSFSGEIMPVFRARCAACHIQATASGLSLKDYTSLLRGGRNGLAIIRGNPGQSLLVRVLQGTEPTIQRMPPGGPYLSDQEIQKIGHWIRQGAPNN
jgi:mono/diheme cytochrome c family protein